MSFVQAVKILTILLETSETRYLHEMGETIVLA